MLASIVGLGLCAGLGMSIVVNTVVVVAGSHCVPHQQRLHRRSKWFMLVVTNQCRTRCSSVGGGGSMGDDLECHVIHGRQSVALRCAAFNVMLPQLVPSVVPSDVGVVD